MTSEERAQQLYATWRHEMDVRVPVRNEYWHPDGGGALIYVRRQLTDWHGLSPNERDVWLAVAAVVEEVAV